MMVSLMKKRQLLTNEGFWPWQIQEGVTEMISINVDHLLKRLKPFIVSF